MKYNRRNPFITLIVIQISLLNNLFLYLQKYKEDVEL